MSILRTQEFEEGCGLFHDDFDPILANKLMRQFGTKVYVPWPETEATFMLTKEDIEDAKADKDAVYVLVCSDVIVPPGTDIKYRAVSKSYSNCIRRIEDCIIVVARENVGLALITAEWETKDAIEKIRKEKLNEQIEQFIKKDNKAELDEAKRAVEQAKSNTTYYATQLRDAINNANNAAEKYELLCTKETKTEDLIKEVKEQLDELLDSPKLKEVYFTDNKIVYKTNEMSIKDELGNIRPIGEFTVTLNMEKIEVSIINTNNHINKTLWKERSGGETPPQHPHVDYKGYPCTGNMAEPLTETCADRNIAQAWQIIYSYLTSYNPDDIWGKRLKYWDTEKGEAEVPISEGKGLTCVSCGCDLDEDEDSYYTCEDCGEIICEDCVVFAANDAYCKDCAENHYSDCEDEHFDKNVKIYICSHCDETFSENFDDMYIGKSGDLYCCRDCAADEGDLCAEDEPNEDDEA